MYSKFYQQNSKDMNEMAVMTFSMLTVIIIYILPILYFVNAVHLLVALKPFRSSKKDGILIFKA